MTGAEGIAAPDKQQEVLLYVKHTEGKGRGAFASRPLKQGELVEVAHCIWFSREQYVTHLKHTELEHYLFTTRRGNYMLALGHGSIFNHNDPPNLRYLLDEDDRVIRYYTARDIAEDEELTIFYGSVLWFKDVTRQDRIEGEDGGSDSDNPDFLGSIDV